MCLIDIAEILCVKSQFLKWPLEGGFENKSTDAQQKEKTKPVHKEKGVEGRDVV